MDKLKLIGQPLGASVIIRRLVSNFVDKFDRPVSAETISQLSDLIEKESPSSV